MKHAERSAFLQRRLGSGNVPSSAQVYRRLILLSRPYWTRLLVGTIFGILFAGSTTGLLVALKGTLARIFDPQVPLAAAMLIAGALVPLAVLRGVGYYFSVYFVNWVGNRAVMDLRNRAFESLVQLSPAYLMRRKSGDIISRVASDTTQIESAVSTVLGDLVRQPLAAAGMVGFLVWLDVRLALISLLLFPVCLVPVLLFGRRVKRFAREGREQMGELVSVLQEAVLGLRVVQAFNMEPYEMERFRRRSRQVFSRVMRVIRARAAVEPLIVTISVVGLAAALVYSRWSGMSADEFFAFALALVGLYEPVKKLSTLHLVIQRSTAAAARVFEIVDAPVGVTDRPDAVNLVPPVEIIRYRGVAFRYEREEEAVLQGIDLEVRSGQCLAIVGSSGSGKTTLVNLLPRFFDVTEGRIEINGRDIREYTLRSLRDCIGIVTQETVLFNDTVANNIAYGKAGASREEVVEAARRAHAHEFISRLPQGYDTVIGDRGVRLSGGEAQRIAIARAILKNPPILILDEATSALDSESERLVQQALDELMAKRTVLAIAHRLSTIAHADQIVVLDGGRIVERGTHDELLRRGGLYRYFYELQFQRNTADRND